MRTLVYTRSGRPVGQCQYSSLLSPILSLCLRRYRQRLVVILCIEAPDPLTHWAISAATRESPTSQPTQTCKTSLEFHQTNFDSKIILGYHWTEVLYIWWNIKCYSNSKIDTAYHGTFCEIDRQHVVNIMKYWNIICISQNLKCLVVIVRLSGLSGD